MVLITVAMLVYSGAFVVILVFGTWFVSDYCAALIALQTSLVSSVRLLDGDSWEDRLVSFRGRRQNTDYMNQFLACELVQAVIGGHGRHRAREVVCVWVKPTSLYKLANCDGYEHGAPVPL